MLEDVFGRGELRVSSLHWQGIDRLGHGVSVEATADDGLIEAVSLPDATALVLGV